MRPSVLDTLERARQFFRPNPALSEQLSKLTELLDEIYQGRDIGLVSPLLLFWTRNASHFLEEMKGCQGVEQATFTNGYFNNGDPDLQIFSELDGRDLLIISSMMNDDFLQLQELLWTISRQSDPRSITVVITCFGGQTMERRAPHEVRFTTAPARAEMLAQACGSYASRTEFILCDLHVSSIAEMFCGVQARELWLMPIVVDVCAELGEKTFLSSKGASGLTLAFPDSGRVKTVEAYASATDLPIGGIIKTRKGPGEVTPLYVVGEFEDRLVLLTDDIFRSGGTITKAIEQIMGKSARGVYVFCSHWECVSDEAMRRLVQTPGFLGAFTTNSHPNALRIADNPEFSEHLRVRSIVPLLLETIRRGKG